MKNKKPSNYITIKESRAIIKDNLKKMKYYEGLKKKNVNPEEYITTMKDENNIIEVENLKTVFFTDNGTVQSVNCVSLTYLKIKLLGLLVNLVVERVSLLFQLCNLFKPLKVK